MRLFAAVEIDPALKRAAGALIDELRTRARRLAPRAAITWVGPERLHLTLAFIGEVGTARLVAIRDALQIGHLVQAFEMQCRGAGAFPESGRPRVLWAGIERGRAPLVNLASEISARLGAAGVAIGARPYRPHLTLARVRDAAGLKPVPLFHDLETTELGTMTVGAITLFQSRLSSAGAVYTVIERMQLQGTGQS